MIQCLFTGILAALGLAFPGGVIAQAPQEPARPQGQDRPALVWKALWVRAAPLTKTMHLELMARRAKQMGFNVVIAEPSDAMASAVHGQGLQLYAWVTALKGLAPPDFFAAHPGYAQMVRPEEEALIGAPRGNPDRDNVHSGPWLCPDYGLLPVERRALENLVQRYPIEGIALDNVGYRNYYACFCQYSELQRAALARRRPTLLRSQILREFSEQALVGYVRQVADTVKALKPQLKLAVHVHPDFDLNPRYGNMLDVDYCGETIAWRHPPFWPLEKVMKRTQLFLEAEGEYDGANLFVPFIGVCSENPPHYAKRLRAEIRIARRAGTGLVMIGYYEALAAHPDLADVVIQELNAP